MFDLCSFVCLLLAGWLAGWLIGRSADCCLSACLPACLPARLPVCPARQPASLVSVRLFVYSVVCLFSGTPGRSVSCLFVRLLIHLMFVCSERGLFVWFLVCLLVRLFIPCKYRESREGSRENSPLPLIQLTGWNRCCEYSLLVLF